MMDELESVIRYARTKLREEVAAMDDKTDAIACKGLFPVYVQRKYHEVGEVARHPETGSPKECMTAYDGAVQQCSRIGRLTTGRSGSLGTAAKRNTPCRGKRRLEHTICINLGNT